MKNESPQKRKHLQFMTDDQKGRSKIKNSAVKQIRSKHINWWNYNIQHTYPKLFISWIGNWWLPERYIMKMNNEDKRRRVNRGDCKIPAWAILEKKTNYLLWLCTTYSNHRLSKILFNGISQYEEQEVIKKPEH